MLSQRLVRAAGAATPRSALRAFSSTSQQLKVPSMADVTPAPPERRVLQREIQAVPRA
ncbi:hypothetical protein CH063_12775, partial [Colletotrichum higginsianum]